MALGSWGDKKMVELWDVSPLEVGIGPYLWLKIGSWNVIFPTIMAL
jgi:hypothetical protein